MYISDLTFIRMCENQLRNHLKYSSINDSKYSIRLGENKMTRLMRTPVKPPTPTQCTSINKNVDPIILHQPMTSSHYMLYKIE